MLKVQGFKSEVSADPRPHLEQLNRQSLYYLLNANGIKVASDIPKTKMLLMAAASDVDLVILREDGGFSFRNVQAYKDERDGQIKIVRPEADKVEPEKLPKKNKKAEPEAEVVEEAAAPDEKL